MLKRMLTLVMLSFIMQPAKANTIDDDMKVLTQAIYFEARDQILMGQIAVGCVIMNRVKKVNWPNTVRGVVHQRLQFSYLNDGKPETFDDHKAHYIAFMMAEKVVHTNVCDLFDGADHYLNKDKSSATWYKSMDFLMQIDEHTFYRRDKL